MVCFRLTTFQGLYYPGFDRPYFSTWVPLKVTSSRPQHSRVDTRPLVILNIRLISLEMESSPARLVYHLLTPWFKGPARSCLRYIDLPFNIQAIPEAATFHQRCASALAELGPCVVHLYRLANTHSLSQPHQCPHRRVYLHTHP